MKEYVPFNDITLIGIHPYHHPRNKDLPRLRHQLRQSKMQIGKKFPNKGMNRETKAAGKIGLIETKLISIRVTTSFFVTQDPNFHRAMELKSILDPLLVLSRKKTRYVPGHIGVETKVASKTTQLSNEDNPVSRSLDLTSDILNSRATLSVQETKGNKEERIEVYRQSFEGTDPLKKLPLYGLK